MARLSPNEDVITSLELRGNSNVRGGGGPLDSMKANAIDLDYIGQMARAGAGAPERLGRLHHRDLRNTYPPGAWRGRRSRSRRGRRHSHRIWSGARMASSSSYRAAEKDHLESQSAPCTLNATGEPGRGLTHGAFPERRRIPRGPTSSDTSFCEVRAQSLNAALEGDGLRNAFFSGGVSFKERGFEAGAAEARYQPGKGILNLSGSGNPRPFVTDDQIASKREKST